MALLRVRAHLRHRPPLPRPFSSSTSSPFPPPPPTPTSADPPPPSRFADIRDRFNSTGPSASPPRAAPSLDDLRRSLNHFRKSHPTTASSSSSSTSPAPSFLDVFASNPSSASAPTAPSPSSYPFQSLRESLNKTGPAAAGALPVPGAKSLDWRSLLSQRQEPAGPEAVFGREKAGTKGTQSGAEGGLRFLRQYTYDELGKRLGDLRPAGAGKDGKEWFSLEELSARLGRLREMDKEERQRAPPPGMGTDVLRQALQGLTTKEQKKKTDSVQSMSILLGFSGQPILQGKPQEELVERYFHPDHMSSGEKVKLELQRVRDEFKMSENDSGSARVQVAQLTTKIKHLSATLHKKDKHSRKGLQEMVQRRKKYLKYLRGTDWDSYSLALSKLGLRDVPEFKPPDYKSKSSTKAKAKTKRKSKRKMKA